MLILRLRFALSPRQNEEKRQEKKIRTLLKSLAPPSDHFPNIFHQQISPLSRIRLLLRLTNPTLMQQIRPATEGSLPLRRKVRPLNECTINKTMEILLDLLPVLVRDLIILMIQAQHIGQGVAGAALCGLVPWRSCKNWFSHGR
jgi:hypothetical protein